MAFDQSHAIVACLLLNAGMVKQEDQDYSKFLLDAVSQTRGVNWAFTKLIEYIIFISYICQNIDR